MDAKGTVKWLVLERYTFMDMGDLRSAMPLLDCSPSGEAIEKGHLPVYRPPRRGVAGSQVELLKPDWSGTLRAPYGGNCASLYLRYPLKKFR